eukprot:jgi/Galph1/2194/GphlegSOOS_G871.1
MNDTQVRQQVQQMVSFIKQEAEEKANEIRVKTEEEFNARKLSSVEAEKARIRLEYDRKFKQIESKLRVAYSTELNASRLSVLKLREDLLRDLYNNVESELGNFTKNTADYEKLIEKLLVQSFLTLGDTEVTVTCREEDLELVEKVLKEATKYCNSKQSLQVKAVIDKEHFLPKTSVGGVSVSSHEGKIVCNNTFEARLEIAYQQNLPEIRRLFFDETSLWK